MSILGSLGWILAGGAYAAKEGAKSVANSSLNIEYDESSKDINYDARWASFDHARQRELYKIYTEDFLEFVALGEAVCLGYLYGRNEYDRILRTDGHYGVYFKEVARNVAQAEGWVYDESLHLDKEESKKYHRHDYRVPTEQEKKYGVVDHSQWIEGIPWIGDNNHWWINGQDTEIQASIWNFPTVKENGAWSFGGSETDFKAPGNLLSASNPGEPRIRGKNVKGEWHWFMSFPTQGVQSAFWDYGPEKDMGVDQSHSSPKLRPDGYYWCGDKKTDMRVKWSPKDGVAYVLKQGRICFPAVVWDESSDYRWVGDFWIDTRIPSTVRRRLHTNVEREAEIYALYALAEGGLPLLPAREKLWDLAGIPMAVRKQILSDPAHKAELYKLCDLAAYGDLEAFDQIREIVEHPENPIDYSGEWFQEFCKTNDPTANCVDMIARREGWVRKYFGDKVGKDYIYNGRELIQPLIDAKKAELAQQYFNYPRQEELLRILHYCQKGDMAAKYDYYSSIDMNDMDDRLIEFRSNDAESHKVDFGKNGLAMFYFKRKATEEGWLWDDNYPDDARRQQLNAKYKQEAGFSDPTILPLNHARQEEIYKAKFHASENKDKEAQKMLLLFTGTRNSQRLSDDKFFALCADCAKEERWAWDDLFFTAEKCREIVRECAAEETYIPIVSSQETD